MFNDLANNNSSKRKMKEVERGNHFNPFNVQTLQFASPNDRRPPHNGRVQQILNNAAPLKPFSFTSLLTAEDEDGDDDSLVTAIKSQSDQVDHMISLHSDILRQALGGMLEKHQKTIHRAAEERASKKLKQKEIQLQKNSAHNEDLKRKAERYKKEIERLQLKVTRLEQDTLALKSALKNGTVAQRQGADEEADESSSFEDPDRVPPVRLDCKVCGRQMATVMMWPCRHVCVCTGCEASTKYCPVCRLVKTASVEVRLNHN